jgi:hypothetical protein
VVVPPGSDNTTTILHKPSSCAISTSEMVVRRLTHYLLCYWTVLVFAVEVDLPASAPSGPR